MVQIICFYRCHKTSNATRFLHLYYNCRSTNPLALFMEFKVGDHKTLLVWSLKVVGVDSQLTCS